MNKQYKNAIVVATATKKVATQIKNYLRLYIPDENKFIYCVGKFTFSPLPGTLVNIEGEIKNADPEYTVIQTKQEQLEYISGSQGLLIFESLKKILSRLKISFNENKLYNAIVNPETHLCLINDTDILKFLVAADVPNPANVLTDHTALIAQTLNSAMFQGLEALRYPNLNLKINDDLPFLQDAYPYEVMNGFFPDYVSVSLGLAKHKQTRKSNIYLSDFVSYSAIDNFFNALSVHINNPGLLVEWVNNPRRPSTLTNAFVSEKQTSGSEIFHPEDFAPLQKLGINQPELIASRNNSMYAVDVENNAMLPQGVYQAISRVATMDMLNHDVKPLHNAESLKADIPAFLDPDQKAALESFIDGVPAMLVVGPPGAGKSTIYNEMAEISKKAGEKFIFLTPTGKAAARLNQTSNIDNATTIHSLFYRNKDIDTNSIRGALDGQISQMFPTRLERVINYANSANPDQKPTAKSLYRSMNLPSSLNEYTVFIDESSQLTTSLLASILELKPKRIIMAGDPSQLDPVGAGKPFQDLIELGRQGSLPDYIKVCDLKTDHRATKQLARATAKVRAGQLPLEDVITADKEVVTADMAADAIMENEFSIIESGDLDNAVDILLKTVTQEVKESQPIYQVIGQDDEAIPGVRTIKLNTSIGQQLRAHQVIVPELMVTAFTNDEVDYVANELNDIYRHYIQSSSTGEEIPQLAGLTSNNLLIGDIVMETSNTRLGLSAVGADGNTIESSNTMNGESYIFVGSKIWLPVINDSTSDFGFMFKKLLTQTGYENEYLSEAETEKTKSDWHYKWYMKFMQSNNEEAHQICKMALIENLFVDTNYVLDRKTEDVIEVSVKRQIILPKLPKKVANSIQNDDGGKGLIKYWKISQSGTKDPDALKDRDNYVKLASNSVNAMTTFKSGNAFTAHKAQGSQNKVALCLVSPPLKEDEDFNHESATYTSMTRAQQKAGIIVHGLTVTDMNAIWASARIKKAQIKSPLKMILQGQIAPIGQSNQFNTTYLENGIKNVIDIDKVSYESRISLLQMAHNGVLNRTSNADDEIVNPVIEPVESLIDALTAKEDERKATPSISVVDAVAASEEIELLF